MISSTFSLRKSLLKTFIKRNFEGFGTSQIYLSDKKRRQYREIMTQLHLYSKEVLRENNSIDDGIGVPDWRLTFTLFISWLTVFLVVIRGVRSSGKAAYFLAIFPYAVLFVLLGRAVTLDGSVAGILYFITPTWEKLLTPMIWYHAVAQCFFSLTVCFGAVVMFASHNKFDHDVYRLVTTRH